MLSVVEEKQPCFRNGTQQHKRANNDQSEGQVLVVSTLALRYDKSMFL
jgi:hypothetical protein